MAYASIAVEGGMFPADLLDRIAAGEGDGQRPADFGLAAGRRVTDETQGAFSEIRSYWEAFQYRVKRATGSTTTLTRENWVLPLLQTLGFENIDFQRAAATVGSESYAISHRAGTMPDATVVHIVALDQRLDVRDGRRSPHALVQEYLNRSDAVWAIVTNGRQLRLLRDTARLAKPTYLEFNLEAMVEANLYSEFVLLYRLIHASRFPVPGAAGNECLLEGYYDQGVAQGGRVREKLRDGVAEALNVLGSAFLAHPESTALRARFESGALNAPAYYRQLLRLVYRLLFLMAAEERKLVFPSETPVANQAVYDKYYSISRLRDRCERRFSEDRYSDLWLGLRQTFALFREDGLAAKLGLHALNGELFGPDACVDLEQAGCQNRDLLAAMFKLSTYLDDKVRRRVNYAFLDVEEFGSVYESLLDYHPRVTLAPAAFDLITGSERKQTGSYYTPPELVRELIESALVPVVEERLAAARTKDAKIEALLSLRVCDPAAGSGHFLLAAGRRIARELAKVRSEEAEPPPEEYRHALRDVIRHCLYAVDKNPLAVDLCKVALWIEGHNAGLPLSFLDNHVKCGDSLVGVFDLQVLVDGIPDDAYKPVTGDDKNAARGFRDQNKREKRGQARLTTFDPESLERQLAPEFAALGDLEEVTPDDVHAKEELYSRLRAGGTDWWRLRVACDLWTYAFFAPQQPQSASELQTIPTTSLVKETLAGSNEHAVAQGRAMAGSIAHPFFHWPLEFPDVFANGGFDVVIGNPPMLGSKRIKGALGDKYREFIMCMFKPAGGLSDLCAYFFRRALDLLRSSGQFGLVATNTISQGDTREGGLAVLVKSGTVIFARRFIRWPGAANLEVNIIAMRKGAWSGIRVLDGQTVDYISSRLDSEVEAEELALRSNKNKAFIGSVIAGAGFILDSDTASKLCADKRNQDCLFPFLIGEDVNSRLDHSPSRWVINFFDWTEERAATYPDLLAIVRAKVKPQRDAVNRDRYRTRWWLYAEACPGLYHQISSMDSVLVRSRVSEFHMLARVPTSYVYSDAVVVFAFEDDYSFGLLQSAIHECWLRRNASTMRTDIRYTPTDCFETFPFPQQVEPAAQAWVERVSKELGELRRQVMMALNLGLTKTYHLFHDPSYHEHALTQLRQLHAEMDCAILACYRWNDIDPEHGFHTNERGQTRFTVSPEARREILRRLLDLNLRVAESERIGLASPVAARRVSERLAEGIV